MRRLLLLPLLLGAALLRAEVPVTEFDFSNAGTTDNGHDWTGQEGWTNAFEKKCKARINGIGIAPRSTGAQSGMKYARETGDAETIAQITVTCMASGTTAANASKTHTLGVRVNNTLMTGSFSFDGAVDSPLSLTFRLDSPTEVTSVVITNESDQSGNKSLFEINSVSWQADFPGIEATFNAPEKAVVLSTISVSLSTVTGGSGVYTDKCFTFNGKTIHVEGSEVVTFTAPEEDGILTLTLTVTDSSGETAVFTQAIQIVFKVPPINLQASAITRNGFTLSWVQPFSSAVTAYAIRVQPETLSKLTGPHTPEWQRADGFRELESPIDLVRLANGLPINSITLNTSWEGSLDYAFDSGTWESAEAFNGNHLLTGLTREDTLLRLRTDADTPPADFTLTLNLGTVAEQKLDAVGSNHTVTFTDLPTGNTFHAIVSAFYPQADDTVHSIASESLRVELPPIPPFASVTNEVRFQALTFTWPKGDEALKGECVILGERRPSSAVAEGLYLSRVCFTEPPDNAEGLTRSKAIALTNTSSRAIALDGSVTFTITRPRRKEEIAAGKTEPVVSTWDFSVKNEAKEKAFPYSVPAGGDLVFISENWPVTDLREGAVIVSAAALNNLTEEYTLSLSRNGTVCNTLKPEINAVVRLRENPLTETEVTAITNETLTLDSFYAPWGNLMETVTLRQIPLTAASGSAQIFYSGFLTDIGTLSTVRAHCYLMDGYTRSAETVVELYTAPEPALAPGYLLRLH